MRLIDADALKETIASNVYPIADAFNSRDYGMFWTGGIEKAIDEQPTIEPKTGEWTPIHKGERGFSAGDFRCSICHQPNKCYTMTNYCSHCGAYMKPTEKNDQ